MTKPYVPPPHSSTVAHFHNHDRIVYLLYVEDAELRQPIAAHFDKREALAQVERATTKLVMEAKVIDVSTLRKEILDRLDPIERLVIDPPQHNPKR